jgi:hypothetical protein
MALKCAIIYGTGLSFVTKPNKFAANLNRNFAGVTGCFSMALARFSTLPTSG